MRYVILALLFTGCIFSVFSREKSSVFEPILFAVKADGNMVIDGKDTESCYSKAQRTSSFKTRFGEESVVPTYVKAAYDEKNLYFFYDCHEPENDVSMQPTDAVELFLNGNEKDRSFYYQFYITLENIMIVNQKKIPVQDPEVFNKFKVRINRKEKGYSVEFAVARSLFPESPNMLWRVNFNRDRNGKNTSENFTCWSPTGLDFHSPSRFGYLFLGDPKTFLKIYYLDKAKEQMAKIRAFAKKYPADIPASDLKKFDDDLKAFEISLSKHPEAADGVKLLQEMENFLNKLLFVQLQNKFREFNRTIPEKELSDMLFESQRNVPTAEKWNKNIKNNIIYSDKSKGDTYLDPYIPADFYDKISKGEFNRNIFPVFSDRKAWEKARKSQYADMIIAQADEVLKNPIPQLLFSNYRRFVIDGDRANYENKYFARRKNMAHLALALCLTGDKEKYMPGLLDYVIAILEESTWCVPAHTQWQREKKLLKGLQPVDLFASETGSTMAILYHVLGDELDKYSENLSERIREQTLKRTIYSIFYHPESSTMNWWYKKMSTASNWSTWCSYSNLITAILLEKDPERLSQFIHEFLKVNAHYAFLFRDDGYCDEGPGYYAKAGLKFISALCLMQKIRPGSMDKMFAEPKIRAIFEYLAHVRIGEKHVVNYGDNGPYLPNNANIVIYSKNLKSDIMKDLGRNKTFSLGSCADYFDTGMQLLFDLPEMTNVQAADPVPFSCFKNSLAILRSKTFAVAVKAGNNGEQHNHNDLGHVTIYFKGAPLIVDTGHDRYSWINFSPKRYTLWYNRGSGHNAPVFGTSEQIFGLHYTATFPKADPGNVTVDLSNAYPKSAGVQKFIRSVDFTPEKIILKDQFQLAAPKPAVIKFLTPYKVEVLNKNTLRFGGVRMTFNGLDLQNIGTYKMNLYWKNPLTSIELKSTSNDYKIIFQE